MKLTVKTLKGGKFDVQVEESHTVAQVKGVIVRRTWCSWCCDGWSRAEKAAPLGAVVGTDGGVTGVSVALKLLNL